MKKTTKELAKRLVSAEEYEEFFASNKESFLDMTLSEYLLKLLEDKQLTTVQVARTTGLGDYLYKLVSGKKNNPSRDILIRLAFGMGLELDEISFLMRITHFHDLDSRDKRDAAILFCLNKNYDLQRTDEMLYQLHLRTLEK